MFSIFQNKNQSQASATKLSPEEMAEKINALQKELDHLKSALSRDFNVNISKQSEKIVADAFAEISERAESVRVTGNEKVVEGVFDGQNMVGSDGAVYDVPANYASKSKLVEGDIMKLTINNLGAFIYKQIKPIERTRLRGVLTQDKQDLQYYVEADGKKWRLLTASVTYYKGEPGDEVIFFIPTESGSKWAAVDNIVKM